MFSFGKKPNSPKPNLARSNNIQAAVDDVLTHFDVMDGDNQFNLAHFLQKTDINQNSVTFTFKLPITLNLSPEQIHTKLSQLLHPHGVNEVNLNIIQEKKPSDASACQSSKKTHHQTLPPVKDAMVSSAEKNSAGNAGSVQPKKPPTQAQIPPHPRIKHVLVVASGKGGVGKSTTTVNIALALKQLGASVGVLDADIYGPSIPTMLGVAEKMPQYENEQFVPINAYDMPVLSIGNLLGADNMPVAWRGPKATGALMQLFNQTNWPNLDYLVIDMPPGTGDIQLTLAQRIPVTASVIVTTPQHVALMDAQKGIEMFQKVSIPVLGVVENMALHTCSQCGHTEAIFGSGGGLKISNHYDVPLLGQLPLAAGIREQADKGKPSVAQGDDYAGFYISIAQKIQDSIGQYSKKHDNKRIF